MRIFHTLLFLCCLFGSKAQIIEVPAEINHRVFNEYRKEQFAKFKKIESFKNRYSTPSIIPRDLIEEELFVVISGESSTVCPELEDGVITSIVDCSNINFGAASLMDNCLTFTSNSGVDIGMDTVCVEVCDSNMVCDTLQYPILIKRANGLFLQTETVLDAGADIELCGDTTLFEGNFQSAQIIGCGFEDFGTTANSTENCFQYFAGTFSEQDTICFLVCDQYSICDTLVYPFLVAQDTIGLPFFDDFSYEGPYPSNDLWLTNDVFVNNTLGINPPSIGMATFDGLNSGGTPYGSAGFSDFLVSTYLDLSPYNSDSDVYLSFFIQPKGQGDNPEEDDLLILEFKDVQGTWDTIRNFSSDLQPGISVLEGFDFEAVKIEVDKYLYNGFQFRFKNISAGRGIADLWHLDYVKLNSNESGEPFSPDIAFVKPASSILKNYSAMPWHQFRGFEAQELNDEMEIALFNHFGFTETAEPSSVSIVEQNTGITVLPEAELLKLLGSVNQKDVPPDTLVEYTNPFPSYIGGMSNSAFDDEDELIFYTIYKFDQNEEALLTEGNNESRRRTVFSNYFAYDDGTAESNLAAQGAGTQAAVKFTSNVADSLKGVQMHIPHVFSDVSSQSFNLKVWVGSLDTEPVYERSLISPFYVDNVFDTLQGFTSYRLQDFLGNPTPVYIPAGDFYIGWQQISNEFENAIPIGFDLDSPAEEQLIYMNIGAGWVTIPDRNQGALMIRPVVGEEAAIETLVEEINPTYDRVFTIIPNPTSGNIEITLKDRDLKNYNMKIYSIDGVLRINDANPTNKTTLNLESGYYIMNLSKKDGSETLIKKLIVSK